MIHYYGIFDVTGLPTAFFNTEVHGELTRPVYGELVTVPLYTTNINELGDVEQVLYAYGPDPNVSPNPPIIGEEPNPYCSIPTEAIGLTEQQWLEFINNSGLRIWQDGQVVVYDPPLPEVTIDDYENAIQHLVDNKPKERRFRDGVTMASYVASTQAQWAAEAQAFVAWRDQIWLMAYAELEKVMNGQRPQPTVAEFIAELPVLVWPALPAGESLEARPSL